MTTTIEADARLIEVYSLPLLGCLGAIYQTREGFLAVAVEHDNELTPIDRPQATKERALEAFPAPLFSVL